MRFATSRFGEAAATANQLVSFILKERRELKFIASNAFGEEKGSGRSESVAKNSARSKKRSSGRFRSCSRGNFRRGIPRICKLRRPEHCWITSYRKGKWSKGFSWKRGTNKESESEFGFTGETINHNSFSPLGKQWNSVAIESAFKSTSSTFKFNRDRPDKSGEWERLGSCRMFVARIVKHCSCDTFGRTWKIPNNKKVRGSISSK